VDRTRVLVVYGTRPEAIKLAPVVAALRAAPDRFETVVCTTAQHRDMVDQVERLLALAPDRDLDLMTADQSLNELASRVLVALDTVLAEEQPDWVLVQGDTTTAMAAALAAFHRGVRVGHVEAGLRTGDLANPFPEEANRRVIDVVAAAHFAPTARARDALLAEGIPEATVHLTGNTAVDALRALAPTSAAVAGSGRTEVLLTVHRRESFGAPLRGILGAVAELAGRFPDVRFVYPVHPNPHVAGPARAQLGGIANLDLCDPLDYADLVDHLARSRLVLTDSGGIQEEAPTFGTPVLVLRERTERLEGIDAGVARLVGVDPERIVAEATTLLTDDDAHRAMATAGNPYGDGHAAARIVAVLAGAPWSPWEGPG
jgi:UDP-N-acetylglucosamine 2-epimerase (non-hydrolysing)